jgi:hypothetical protein
MPQVYHNVNDTLCPYCFLNSSVRFVHLHRKEFFVTKQVLICWQNINKQKKNPIYTTNTITLVATQLVTLQRSWRMSYVLKIGRNVPDKVFVNGNYQRNE